MTNKYVLSTIAATYALLSISSAAFAMQPSEEERLDFLFSSKKKREISELKKAARTGDLEAVKSLIEETSTFYSKIPRNQREKREMAEIALEEAVRNDHIEGVKHIMTLRNRTGQRLIPDDKIHPFTDESIYPPVEQNIKEYLRGVLEGREEE